jgi:hypothetical protein
LEEEQTQISLNEFSYCLFTAGAPRGLRQPANFLRQFQSKPIVVLYRITAVFVQRVKKSIMAISRLRGVQEIRWYE